jgi:hypothetical protein
VVLALSVGVFAWLAVDGRFYWHDIRYLYAVSQYAVSDLLAGVWNPQYGESLNASASGAFYLTKIAFLAPLAWFVSLIPISQGGLEAIVSISTLLCLISALIFAIFVRTLDSTARDSNLWIVATALLLVSPTLPWLAGKIIAEILALPLILVSLVAGYAWLKNPHRLLLLLVSSLAFCIAVLARVNISAVVICFFLSYGMTTHESQTKSLCWRVTLGLAALQVLLLCVAFAGSAVGWSGLVGYAESVIGKGRGALASSLGGMASFGLLLPLAIVAIFARRGPLSKLLGVWFLTTAASTLVVISLYQVEARYLVGPLVPLSALAAMGLLTTTEWLRRRLTAAVSVVLAWTVIVVANGVASSLLPYEIDYWDMQDAVESSLEDNAVLLLPWAYSDFHFIRVVWPEVDAYSVHVPRDAAGNLAGYSPEWQKILENWYGDRFLLDFEDLAAVVNDRDVYYLGWGVHPPLQNWADNATRLGLTNVADMLTRLGGQSHWDQCWVVSSDGLQLSEFRQFGQYSLSKVDLN